MEQITKSAVGRMRITVPSPKIRKPGPFTLPAIKPEYASFSHLLAHAISQLKELPDFSDDTKIAVMSDFSGEHKGARFNTYSFLLMAYNKVGPFEKKVHELRERYGLLQPYSEFAFKDLAFGPRSRALPDFLHLIDNFIHGAVVTIAIDKRIGSVFGKSKKDTHTAIEQQLSTMDLGQWKGATAEKMLRVCHAIAVFTALTTHAKQRLLWYCDHDAINQDARDRRFEHMQNIFVRVLGMYCKHEFDIVGFGKSFPEKSHLDDLLSIPDLAAGVVQDLLQAHDTGIDAVPGVQEKEMLIRWIATQGRFLSKIPSKSVNFQTVNLAAGSSRLLLYEKLNDDCVHLLCGHCKASLQLHFTEGCSVRDIVISSLIPRYVSRDEEVWKSRHQMRQHRLGDASTMFNLLLPVHIG